MFELRVERLRQSVVHGDVVAETSCDNELRRSVELAQILGGGIEEFVLLGIEVPARSVNNWSCRVTACVSGRKDLPQAWSNVDGFDGVINDLDTY